jgi:hypothetical protein
MKKLGLVLAALVAVCQGASPAKERPWQEGMLLNPENNAYFKSTEKTVTSTLSTGIFQGANSESEVPKTPVSVRDNYVLNAADSAYLVERTRLSNSPAANVFITMQVKFFVQKDKLYMVDRNGKEVVTKIVKQSRKERLADGQ